MGQKVRRGPARSGLVPGVIHACRVASTQEKSTRVTDAEDRPTSVLSEHCYQC